MALSVNTVWEVRTAGSNNNGGGFVTGASGSDFSQQNSAQATLSAASKVHTTTTQINVSAGDYTVTSNDVGNLLHITGGTATAGFFQITAVDIPNNRWTLDRSAGSSTQTVVGAMGGALADPAIAWSAAIAANKVFVKNGTYSFTSTSNNVAGGKMSPGAAGTYLIGYSSTRSFGNSDTAPVFQLNVASGQFFAGSPLTVYNIVFDGNSTGSVSGTILSVYRRCVFKNFSVAGGATNMLVGCELTTNSVSVFTGPNFFWCDIHANTAAQSVTGSVVAFCNVYANTGATTDGLSISNGSGLIAHCNFYGNGRDGLRIGANNSVVGPVIQNCHAEGNAGFGFNNTGSGSYTLIACGDYNNTSGRTSGTVNDLNPITLSGSAYTAAGSGDFSLNSTSGAGASLRGAGYVLATSQTFLAGTTTSYPDVGAAQHADPAPSSSGEHAWAFAG